MYRLAVYQMTGFLSPYTRIRSSSRSHTAFISKFAASNIPTPATQILELSPKIMDGPTVVAVAHATSFSEPMDWASMVEEDIKMKDYDSSKFSESEEPTKMFSTFHTWCLQGGMDSLSPITFRHFLGCVELISSRSDLYDYPGIQHAASLALGDYEAPDGDNLSRLLPYRQDEIKDILNDLYSLELAEDQFDTGEVIGGRWNVVSQLTGIHGSFNRGVFRVTDVCDPAGTHRIMKTLPSRAMYPGFSARKISLLSSVKHPNILEILDGSVPDGRHDTGYMVTELCDGGTLADLLGKYVNAGDFVLEPFVWEIFESLVSAVSFLHYGPNEQESWDPIFHRDIIPTNCFYTSRSTGGTSSNAPQ
jgi:serine/threonine protein kinase